jgi:hypothetical protein
MEEYLNLAFCLPTSRAILFMRNKKSLILLVSDVDL